MISNIGSDDQAEGNLVKQFSTLLSIPADNSDLFTVDSPRRDATSAPNVSFQESLHLVDEEDTFRSHIAAGFRGDMFYTKCEEDPNL